MIGVHGKQMLSRSDTYVIDMCNNNLNFPSFIQI